MFSLRKFGFGICAALMANGVNAAIVIESWTLVTGVLDSVEPNFAGTETVQNPFIATYNNVSGASQAYADFDFSWNDTAGDFLLQVSHRAADVDPSILRALSQGYIYITTNADTLFAYDANYSYSLPVVPMRVIFEMGVADVLPPYDSPIGYANYYDTWDGAPASGSFPESGQVTLPAGHTWTLVYNMFVEADYGNSGQIASADGYLHFTLTEVPEPATLFPLALAAMLLRQRRK